MPKVSVIVPVYNVEPYLGQCLDTILLQTLQDIEVICVDDGSTDGSLSILQTYAMFDDRLKVIHQENAGLGGARNRGMKEASGKYIIFLDSDDFFHPEMLEKMVAKAEEDCSDTVICGYFLFDNMTEEDCVEEKIDNKYLQASPLSPKDYSTELFDICSAVVWTKLFRTEFINKNKLKFFDDKYAEDIPFSYTAMALSNKISFLEDCLVHYRQNRTGQLTDNRDKHGTNISIPLVELYDNLTQRDLIDVFLPGYINRFLKILAWEIQARTPDGKRDFLTKFIKGLSSEVSNLTFGYNNGTPKFSIIVCAYNADKFLSECLDSCLNQTLKEIEIICVDDGSTDNTLQILNQYAQKDKRIKIIHQENKGLSISRNNAMKLATGEYVWYVDADDYIDEDSCECLYLYSKIYDLDMLSLAAIDFKNDTRVEHENPYHILRWLPEKFTPVFTWQQITSILPQLAVTSPLTIYRRSFLDEHSITWLNKKVAYEDTPFFTECMLKGANMGALPVKFYHKRIHADAITQNISTNFPDYCWVVEYTFGVVKKLSSDSAVLNLFINTYLVKVFTHYQKKLSEDLQKKMMPYFYKLCLCVLSKYHLPLSDTLKDLCKDYLKNTTIKERLFFWYSSILAKWAISGYAIMPFNLSVKPNLNISILGVPLLKYSKKTDTTYTRVFHNFIEGKIKNKKIQIPDIFKKPTAIPDQKIHAPNLHFLWQDKLMDFHTYTTDFKLALLWGYGDWEPQPELVSYVVKNKIPVVFAEDGFIRSVDTWAHNSIDPKYITGISFTFSNTVPYFDATRPSLFEEMINNKKLIISNAQKERARKCISFIVENYLTKYNHQPIFSLKIGNPKREKVLIIDQSYGDFSIKKGWANENTFKKMLNAAIRENPNADIIIKTHPDSIAPGSSRARGYYSGYKPHDNVYVLTDPINPIALLNVCSKVYVCTSQLGFEALMCGKDVHVFGMPFYAGWGLTKDYQRCRRRKNKRTLEEIFYITYILYSYYINPNTQKKCEIEEAMEYLLKLRQEYFKLYNVKFEP